MLGLCNKALRHCENTKIAHKFRFKNPLYSLDASHIDLSLSLCEWAKVHESKASIKLTVGFNHSNTIPEFVALGDGIENDMVQGRALRFPARSIVVFDKGYIDYQWFAQLTDQNISFVTRLRPIKPDVEKGYSNSCIRIPSTLILLVSSACADCSQWP